MRFVKRRNLVEGEDILYTPQLHWFFAVKHMVLSLPFFIILLGLWFADDSLVSALDQMGYEIMLPVKFLVRQVFLVGFLLVLVIFIYRILFYLNTEYCVTNKRLIFKKGIIRLTVAEIPTDRIESIYCIQGLLGRIFHYGTVYISGIGGRIKIFYMAAHPFALRRKIVSVIEKNKTITVMHGDLSKVMIPPKPEPEPLYRYGTFVRVLPDNGS